MLPLQAVTIRDVLVGISRYARTRREGSVRGAFQRKEESGKDPRVEVSAFPKNLDSQVWNCGPVRDKGKTRSMAYLA